MRVFTEEEKEMISDLYYYKGYSIADIRAELKCRESTLNDYLHENNFIKRDRSILRNADKYKTRKHHFNENYFDEINTEEKAYWLGFLYADGNVSFGKGKNGGTKGGTVELTLKESDKDHLKSFLKSINADKGYPINFRTIKLNDQTYYAYRITLNSIDMCNSLVNKGCVPNKSLILKAPSISNDLIRHFIRGYFDGDGCVSYNDETNVYSVGILGTSSVLKYIKKHSGISDISIRSSNSNGNALNISFGSKSNVLIFYNYIYKNAHIFLNRKKVIFDSLYKYIKQNNEDLYNNTLYDDELIKQKRKGNIVVRISKDFKEIRLFDNMSEAAQTINRNMNCISRCCKHVQYESGGYFWLFYSEYKKVKNDLQNFIINNCVNPKLKNYADCIKTKKVIQLSKLGEYIKTWNSCSEICNSNNKYNKNTLYAKIATNNTSHLYDDYLWYYEDDYIQNTSINTAMELCG